ncbi:MULTISPECIES: nuclear transport factor 2 family protein [unclassified Geodermatophilus]
MPHPNEVLLRDLYAAAAAGDVETLRRLFHPELVWHVPGRNVLAGDYKGFDEVVALFGRLAALTEGTFRSDLHDVVAGDEHVVGLHTERGQRAGRSLEARLALIGHVRDGRLSEVWEGHLDAEAFDAFWSD